MTIDCRITIKISPRPITFHFHDFFIEHFLGYLFFFFTTVFIIICLSTVEIQVTVIQIYCHMMMKVYSIGYSRYICNHFSDSLTYTQQSSFARTAGMSKHLMGSNQKYSNKNLALSSNHKKYNIGRLKVYYCCK